VSAHGNTIDVRAFRQTASYYATGVAVVALEISLARGQPDHRLRLRSSLGKVDHGWKDRRHPSDAGLT